MNTKIENKDLKRLSIDGFKKAKKIPVVIVLDNIRSAQNVGSVFRTMDAFRCEALYLCGICAQPPHREINKTALGASETVTWKYFSHTTDALNSLKNSGYKVMAVEQTQDSILLQDFKLDEDDRIALVLGNEVKGVSQEAIDNCHGSIEIPQIGSKHSLNISVCAGVVLWDIFSEKLLA